MGRILLLAGGLALGLALLFAIRSSLSVDGPGDDPAPRPSDGPGERHGRPAAGPGSHVSGPSRPDLAGATVRVLVTRADGEPGWSARVTLHPDSEEAGDNPPPALTVEAGALVQVNPLDLWNLGGDPNRIEIINRGTLRTGVAGSTPVTFTVAGCTPRPGQWYGIQFLPGSDGYLDPTIIEYGVHGVVITTTNPITIADTIIRYNRHAPPAGNAWGAGMAIFAGTHLITNTDIYSNVVIAGVGGGWAEGGGVQIKSPAGPSLFENCTMYDNQAQNPAAGAAGPAKSSTPVRRAPQGTSLLLHATFDESEHDTDVGHVAGVVGDGELGDGVVGDGRELAVGCGSVEACHGDDLGRRAADAEILGCQIGVIVGGGADLERPGVG